MEVHRYSESDAATAAANELCHTRVFTADPSLARALFETVDPIRVNVVDGPQSIGQHRICWARTAGLPALPVWFDASTVRAPRGTVPLQRG